MDDPALDADAHRRALRTLEIFNSVSQAARPIARAVQRHCPNATSIRLLDVATGSGDVAMTVARFIARRGVNVQLVLCDISKTALESACERMMHNEQPVELIKTDVVVEGIPLFDQSVDVVMCSLFLHHLTDDSVRDLLRELARVARRIVVISDLRRCWAGWLVARAAGLLSGSPVVRIDAPRSVEGAFIERELLQLARRSGLEELEVRRSFPFRMLATWMRPEETTK